MGRTLRQWEDDVRARAGDLGVLQVIEDTLIPAAIAAALARFSRDDPLVATQTFAGDGTTFTFDLTADTAAGYAIGWSSVSRVEWPAGQRIPTYVDLHDWRVDSAGQLTLLRDTPTSGQNVVVEHSRRYPQPGDSAATDLVPDPLFEPVVGLACARLLRARAARMAQDSSVSVHGAFFNLDPAPLFDAARLLEEEYRTTVLGPAAGAVGDEGGPIGYAVSDFDVSAGYLFHGGRR